MESSPGKTWTDFPLEIGGVAVTIVLVLLFLFTRTRNSSAAAAVFAPLRAVLRRQFFETGIKADDPETGYSRLSDDEFEMWCSGRRNCKGALVTLNLEGNSLMAYGPGTPAVNTLTVAIPLEDKGECFVFAAMPVAGKKALIEAREDVARFSQRYSGKEHGLPDVLDTHADHRDVVEAVLKAGAAEVLQLFPDAVQCFHITDQAEVARTPVATLSSRALIITIKLPPRAQYDQLARFVDAAVSFVDALAKLQLSPAARAKVKEHRDDFRREVERRLKEQDDERRREEREAERLKEEKERRAKMTPAQLAKLDAKEREKEMKKTAKMVRAIPKYKQLG